jgi:hypothetical protein
MTGEAAHRDANIIDLRVIGLSSLIDLIVVDLHKARLNNMVAAVTTMMAVVATTVTIAVLHQDDRAVLDLGLTSIVVERVTGIEIVTGTETEIGDMTAVLVAAMAAMAGLVDHLIRADHGRIIRGMKVMAVLARMSRGKEVVVGTATATTTMVHHRVTVEVLLTTQAQTVAVAVAGTMEATMRAEEAMTTMPRQVLLMAMQGRLLLLPMAVKAESVTMTIRVGRDRAEATIWSRSNRVVV